MDYFDDFIEMVTAFAIRFPKKTSVMRTARRMTQTCNVSSMPVALVFHAENTRAANQPRDVSALDALTMSPPPAICTSTAVDNPCDFAAGI